MDSHLLFTQIQNKLPSDIAKIATLKDKFDALSEPKQKNAASKIASLELKSPALVFWLGTFFLGGWGVGRFMIGDTLLGFIRLALALLGIVLALNAVRPLMLLLAIVQWIWWIADMFLVGLKLREQNYQKVLHAIESEQDNG